MRLPVELVDEKGSDSKYKKKKSHKSKSKHKSDNKSHRHSNKHSERHSDKSDNPSPAVDLSPTVTGAASTGIPAFPSLGNTLVPPQPGFSQAMSSATSQISQTLPSTGQAKQQPQIPLPVHLPMDPPVMKATHRQGLLLMYQMIRILVHSTVILNQMRVNCLIVINRQLQML